ncbi:MAG: PAS domain S-box protein [Gemmatimonadales bacterium]|nr:PAS domain S-box protein [Gemmatimonadales bacterium]
MSGGDEPVPSDYAAALEENERLRRTIAELVSLSDEVRESEARKSAVIEHALDCIITIDHDGRVVEFNTAAEETFGLGRDQAIGHELAELMVPPEMRAAHRAGLARFLETGERKMIGRRLEVPALRADGTTFPTELAITLLRTDGPPLFTAHLRDISERKALEASLRASEARFRALMEQAPFSVQIFDPDGHTIRVNRAWEELWGASFEDLGGYNILQDQQLAANGVLAHVERAFAGEPSFVPPSRYDPRETLPHENRHEDAVRWVGAVAYPLKDEHGTVREVVVVHDDITARRRAEAAVQESEEKLRLLADTIPQLAWMAKPDGEIFWFNRRWYEYTGTTPEEMHGWGWQSVHDPEALPKVVDRWKASLATGEPFDMVFPLKGGDGEFRPFLTRVNPLRDDQDHILYWFGTNTDISGIKRMEAALIDADRRKNEFLATLAHELRNPLAPIRNAGHILRMATDNQEVVRSTAEMVERQIGHLVRLVDDLLDVTRIDRGKIELRQERIELASVVTHVVEAAEALIQCVEHDVTVALPPHPVYLNADPIRVAQIIGNLLHNACKFTDNRGTIAVTVQVEEGDGHRPEAVIRIRDNGVGIPAEQLRRIFEMFTQVDTSLERSRDGLGIGLTLAKTLVEMHGGSLEACSDGIGLGSEFVLRLPILVDTPTPLAPVPSPTVSLPKRRTILVVDDNRDSATSLAMLLEVNGHQTHTAYDGAQAVEAAATLQPDVVLLDIGMPTMNGYEACRRIREAPGGTTIVLIALTGWGQDQDRQRSQEAGFDHHLVKPVDPHALMELIGALSRRGEG